MTREDNENRLNLLFRQLDLITLLRHEFEEKLGKRGTEERINEILEEIQSLRKKLKQ